MLEVRNEGWQLKDIKAFTDLLTHMYNVRKAYYNNDLELLAKDLLG